MSGRDLFSNTKVEDLDQLARTQGFTQRGQRNWVRRTRDFVQLVNLQRSQWSSEESYINFALWPLAFGEPPTFAENKFHFRTRAATTRANDLSQFFAFAGCINTLADLRDAEASGQVTGLMTKELRKLLT